MATFTIELKEVIELTKGKIGLDNYPIFNEEYRAGLNSKIIDHYFNQEIGVETVDMFQLAMRRRMNEVMPYFNKLYLSEQLTFDPLITVDLKTLTNSESNQETTGTGNTESSSDNTSRSRAVSSDTPQTMLSGDGDYATSASDVNSSSDVGSTGNESTAGTAAENSNGESSTKGYQGPVSMLLSQYRETLLNIDMMVIDQLKDCFMLIWNNGDSYTESNW